MTSVKFTDPATAATYTWPVNPALDGEQSSQKQRQIERTSNTGTVGATKQVGDDGPYIIDWNVNVFSAAFEQALWEWYTLSRKHTIYLTDFDNEQFEGQIITLGRQRVGVLGGSVGGASDIATRRFYAKYHFQFEVWTFLSGLMATAGVTP